MGFIIIHRLGGKKYSTLNTREHDCSHNRLLFYAQFCLVWHAHL